MVKTMRKPIPPRARLIRESGKIMPSTKIKYKCGYKYQSDESYNVVTGIVPRQEIDTRFLRLDKSGRLLIRSGFAWDGASGPAIDTKNFMAPSLVHDALYQLIRDGYLDYSCRKAADLLLRTHCKICGMWRVRAWWVYVSVRAFGGWWMKNAGNKEVLTAPAP